MFNEIAIKNFFLQELKAKVTCSTQSFNLKYRPKIMTNSCSNLMKLNLLWPMISIWFNKIAIDYIFLKVGETFRRYLQEKDSQFQKLNDQAEIFMASILSTRSKIEQEKEKEQQISSEISSLQVEIENKKKLLNASNKHLTSQAAKIEALKLGACDSMES